MLSLLNEAGYWWIAANLLRDVAALNNMEMLPWDIWGELTARYQADPRLTVPATVYNGVLNRVDEV